MRGIKVVLLLSLLIPALTAAQRPGAPAVPTLARVDFPKYETRVLGNGLTVYALPHREQPVVTLRLLINAGAERDPEETPGVASFTAGLLTQGTKSRSATAIAEAIDRIGGSLSASADMESTVIASSVLKQHVNVAFELMSDILMNPEFAQQELDRMKQQALSNLSANLEDPDFVADMVFARELYGSHPYGRLEGGTLDSIPAIEREDLIDFRERFYSPTVSALAIVGDLSSSEAFALAERYFGNWQRKDVPAPLATAPTPAMRRRVVIVDRPDAVQTEIRVGKLAVPRKDPDYFNVLVTSYVMGGSGASRLNQILRVQRGLTYGAYATITPRRGPGNFYAVTDTRTEKTAEALGLILDQMKTLGETQVPLQELRDAQTYVIGSFPLSIELPANLGTRLTTVFMYDLGSNYLATYRDRIAAVNQRDVLRVSKEKLAPDNVTIVLVGKAADFSESMKAFGEVEIVSANPQ